jgi:hypothetical protein
VEIRTRVELPPFVQRPYDVFVNGIAQTEGEDFEVVGGSLVLARPLRRERRLAFWRWALLFLGVWSSYRPHDTVDVVYTRGERRVVATLKPAEPL